jgi:magnesium transporter
LAELIIYNKEESEFHTDINRDLARKEVPADSVKWIIAGIDEFRFIKDISDFYRIHHLTIEDFFNTSHLPKFEIFENYYFMTLKFLDYTSSKDNSFIIHHTSLILSNNTLFCFTENKTDHVLEDVKTRIQESIGTIRTKNADYLFYRIIDLMVDQYIGAVSIIRNRIDELEDSTVEGETSDITHEILEIKRKISSLRRIAEPMREEIIRVKNTAEGIINPISNVYFQDILDHLNSSISSLETFRDILTDLMELRLAQVSHSMNQIMKTLTVVSAVFIPLTFLAGVYGMNFAYLPELKWKYGYLFFWVFIIIVVAIMLLYMRRKKWF